MDIEQVAAETPGGDRDAARRPARRLQPFHGRRLAYEAGVDADVVRPVGDMLAKLYAAFRGEDATLVEINPLVITPDRDASSRSTRRSRSTTTRCFRHPDNAALDDASAPIRRRRWPPSAG